jgi:hypothetical protein
LLKSPHYFFKHFDFHSSSFEKKERKGQKEREREKLKESFENKNRREEKCEKLIKRYERKRK